MLYMLYTVGASSVDHVHYTLLTLLFDIMVLVLLHATEYYSRIDHITLCANKTSIANYIYRAPYYI
jgi:hypothetical protein